MRTNIPTVLILEDDEHDLELFGLALSEINMELQILHVWDGEEGFSLLNALKKSLLPDLILLDINMPRFNGKEFYSIIQQDAELKNIPVAVISTSSARHDKEFFESRNVPFLVKPNDMKTFKNELQALMKSMII